MLLAHFGLKQPPFAETTLAAAYLPLPSRDSSLRRLRFLLDHDQGPVVLHGQPGLGKSLLARRLAHDLGARTIELGFPILGPERILDYLLHSLADPAKASPPRDPLTDLRDRLASVVHAGGRPLLFIDDAHLIRDPQTFALIKLLLNFSSLGPPDLRLILAGNTEFLLDLDPGLEDLIAGRVPLERFDEQESIAYIRGKLKLAGGQTELFTESALSAIHSETRGSPRQINRLASLALLVAYARDRDQVDAESVAAAAEIPRSVAA